MCFNYTLKIFNKENKSHPKKNVMKVLIIKNGANGISVFMVIFFLEINNRIKLTIVPIQKDRKRAQIPENIPSNHPMPTMSLPSPSPINRPFENNQIKTNGKARTGPEIKLISVGQENKCGTPE